MSHAFDFNSAEIIAKPTSKHEINCLEAFRTYKNPKNIVNCDLGIPSLSDCWKNYIKISSSKFLQIFF